MTPPVATAEHTAGRITVEFGWASRPFKEQFPQLDDETAKHFDADNEALGRLGIRGYLTDSARDAALKKITKAVGAAIAKAERQS